jgi:mono/diheme cytochrome c family protein
VPWSADRLADYLGKGRSPQHGVAAGPMADVIRNLAQVPDSDIKAMATYVASLAGAPGKDRQDQGARAIARARGEDVPARTAAAVQPGASVYAGACAGCHGEAGRRPLDPALNLALSTSVRAVSPNNLVRVVLGGIGRADNQPGPQMPGFAGALTDKQTADVVDYVRANFTDRPQFAGVDVAIRKARQ